MKDQLIIELFISRSEDAIRAVSEKYGKLCRTIAIGILKNEEDAQECVNDAYLALWNTIPPERPDPLVAYLCKVVRNLSLRRYKYNTAEKRNTHYDVALEELVDCLEGVDNVRRFEQEQEFAEVINRFLSTQKKTDRIIFVKKYFFVKETAEIAKELGLSSNYVNVHLHRMREKLRVFLKKEDFYE